MPDREKTRILIIDDDSHHNRIVSALLKKEGYQVEIGWNSVEAVHKNFDFKPHLVLLDIMMPGFSGHSACAALRQLDPELPIVFVSAKSSPEEVSEGYDFGCTRYVTKPFDFDVLLRTIRELLQEADRRKSAREST